MGDRTWYSKAKADEVFAAKTDLGEYAKASDVAGTYATKEALAQAQLGGGAPDLSPYLTRSDASDTYVTKGDAQATYPTKGEVASTYATKTELEGVKNQQGGGSPAPAPAAAPLSALPLRAGQPVPTVGFFGDSWSTEAMMGEGFNLPSVVSRLLRCAPMVSAVDGSGFAHSASGRDGFEVDARVNAVCAAAPNLIVTIGSLNSDKVVDNGDSEGTKITEAVKNFVTKVRAKLPQVPIIMIGPEPSSVTRLLSRSSHVNAKAQKAGVDAVGGLANGVAFVDWLGIADTQAVLWRDGRQYTEGDVVVYGGVAYRVTRAWTPEAEQTPLTAGAPVVQVSDVLSGTGNSGAPKGDGTRDTLLLSDDTHPTKMGAVAFGAAGAKRISDAVASLAAWCKAQGPVTPTAPAAPPTPPPAHGDGLPIMAWLSGGWGDPNRITYSLNDLKAIAALKPPQVALPIQSTADATDSAVAISRFATPANAENKREFSQYGLSTIRGAGVDVAGMNEALNLFEAADIQVLPNVRTGLVDSDAAYYKSSDGKIFGILGARAGKTYQSIHGRGQSKLRSIMKTDYAAFTRVCDATDATADWQLSGTVKDAQKGILSAAKAGDGVWGVVKQTFPDGVWVLVASKDEQEAAKSAAKAAGATIVGWAVGTPEALAAIKA